MYQPFLWPINPPFTYYNCCCHSQRISFVPYTTNFRNDQMTGSQLKCISAADVKLNQLFRMLWEQHVAWTRMLIISIASDLPDEADVTARLLRNAPEMAAIFTHFYGEQVGAEFNRLLTEHLVLAAELVKAAKAGQAQAAAEAERKWYENANELANFLSSINPYLNEAEMREMLHEHLKITKEQAVLRLTKQYKQDIEKYDEIEKQALEMADVFAEGISRQFLHAPM